MQKDRLRYKDMKQTSIGTQIHQNHLWFQSPILMSNSKNANILISINVFYVGSFERKHIIFVPAYDSCRCVNNHIRILVKMAGWGLFYLLTRLCQLQHIFHCFRKEKN